MSIYTLKQKTKAFVIKEDEEIETELFLNGASVKRNTIDYMYAHKLNLPTVEPEVIKYTNGTYSIIEKVQITLKVPVTNVESRIMTIKVELAKHSNSLKETIKVGKHVIVNHLIASVDYNV